MKLKVYKGQQKNSKVEKFITYRTFKFLKLSTPVYRRYTGDIIETYKISNSVTIKLGLNDTSK